MLEENNHKGPVIIITKGDLRNLKTLNYNLDLHIGLSTIGKYHDFDKISHGNFIKNIKFLNNKNIKFSCELRPLMYQINDDIITIDEVFKTCYDNNIPIVYSGIQGDEKLVKYWKDHNIDIKPFPGMSLVLKNLFQKNVDP